VIIIIKKKLYPAAFCIEILGRRKETLASVSDEVPLWSVRVSVKEWWSCDNLY
jgi:hypothetical protein